MLEYNLYQNERVELLNIAETHSPNLVGLPDDEKFVILMSNKANIITNALGKYISNCLKRCIIGFFFLQNNSNQSTLSNHTSQ